MHDQLRFMQWPAHNCQLEEPSLPQPFPYAWIAPYVQMAMAKSVSRSSKHDNNICKRTLDQSTKALSILILPYYWIQRNTFTYPRVLTTIFPDSTSPGSPHAPNKIPWPTFPITAHCCKPLSKALTQPTRKYINSWAQLTKNLTAKFRVDYTWTPQKHKGANNHSTSYYAMCHDINKRPW